MTGPVNHENRMKKQARQKKQTNYSGLKAGRLPKLRRRCRSSLSEFLLNFEPNTAKGEKGNTLRVVAMKLRERKREHLMKEG